MNTMQNKQRGIMGTLALIVIGVALLYYFKVDVRGIYNYIATNYFSYFAVAKQGIQSVNSLGIFPTSTQP